VSTVRAGGLLEAAHDRVRRHPLRLKILALSVRRGRSLDPENLRRELPEPPSVAVIAYHLSVLRQVGLLPAGG
jgi:hypothetical protein